VSENIMLKILNQDAEKLGGRVEMNDPRIGYVLYDENGDVAMESQQAEAIGSRIELFGRMGIPLSAKPQKRRRDHNGN